MFFLLNHNSNPLWPIRNFLFLDKSTICLKTLNIFNFVPNINFESILIYRFAKIINIFLNFNGIQLVNKIILLVTNVDVSNNLPP